jgi:hypothetical protein
MPHYSFPITQDGPFLSLHIAVSQPRRAALLRANKAVPPAVRVRMLVDTGASCTNVDARIIGVLGLAPTGSVPVHTPSTAGTPQNFLTYNVELRLDGSGQHVPSISVLEGDFAAQGFDGLIGRDVLQFARMTYLGPENYVYVSF